MAASGLGDRVAIVSGGEALTYDELQRRALIAAARFAARPGEQIAYVGVNSIAFPLALFGSALAGKPFTPLNYRLPDTELRRLVARTAPAILVADDAMAARVGGIDGVEVVTVSDFLADDAMPDGFEPIEHEIAVLLFTSGTTGEPKAGVLRHANLTSYVISTVEFSGAGEDEAALVSVPPYHIAGISAVLTSVYAGRKLVQLPAFSPESWIDAASTHGVTQAMVVPTMLGRILDTLDERGQALPAMRHLSYGGGRMPEPVIRRAMAKLPQVDFVNAYGLTETSSTIAFLSPDDHRIAIASDDPTWRRRLSSVGMPIPSIELDIRDPDGRPVPPGTAGEIWVRGDQVSGEYLGRSALREGGWYPTSDAGWIDEDGYLFVEGRLDDVIVRGGENISPGEIEDVLRAHPAVADVAVLGVPDDEWGEAVAAVLVLREPATAEALREWVKARLRSTKVPGLVEFRDALPYNDTGKLLRRVLRQELALARAA
jgi:acyl-CoA synthetase (AMP-forming)/AMP-acid ligase II